MAEALPSILQTRENSFRYLGELIERMIHALSAARRCTLEKQDGLPFPYREFDLWTTEHWHDCFIAILRENSYLRRVNEEIKRQEEGGSVEA